LLEREEWTRALLEAVRAGRVQAQEIPLEDRQRLLRSEIPEIRELAVKSVSLPEVKSRADLAEQYKAALDLSGDAASGREVFALACASCHALDGIGHRVGPDLAALRGKDANYWLKNILDPNAVIEPRFINYDLDLKDGRTLSGLIKSETTASVLIVAGNEITETVRREEIEAIRASSVSLMPEGLEQTITVPRMADLLAFVRAAQAKSPERPAGDQVLRDARLVARFILDSTRPPAAREAAVAANPHAAGTLIQEMTRDLTAGTPEEYVRIPWIWRVAIACGKRNDPGQIRAVLQVSLPPGEKLHDWQAVVIGGGVINGISVRDWPRERIGAILASDSSLLSRWEKAMEMASKMADDERVAIGTRYDALRMLGVETWEKRGAQLVRYLAHDVHPELQMGSVSALADMRSHPASRALLAAIPDLTERNGNTALQTFLKDDEGTALLLDAIENGRLSSILLGASLKQQLLESTNAAFAARARQALSR
jgi:putative heme-binding domain-containing protein